MTHTEKATQPSRSRLWWLIPLVLGTIYVLYRHNNSIGKEQEYKKIAGQVFGTIYHVTYQFEEDLKKEIEAELKRYDNSLSPFNSNSVISKVNRNEDVETDTLFQNVFRQSVWVSKQTDGAFDATIAGLANAWGFGFKKGEWPDSLMVDSLLELTNYRNVTLADGKVVKKDPRIMLSYSAIAKGYAVDVIAQYLQRRGVENFMVEIGGEIVTRGVNPRSEAWHIGINKPSDDPAEAQVMQLIIRVSDAGLATSGNYRNFYYKDGKKYAHTIDPRTGYPVQHNLLSATVIAEDCMTADALATAFMVMGREKAEAFVKARPHIAACFIYSDENGDYQLWLTDNMKDLIVDDDPLAI